MLAALAVSQIFSWIVIVGLAFALVAVARQVGVLHLRLAPAGALVTAHGPAVGEAAPVLDLTTIDDAAITVGKPLEKGHMQLLFFVSPQCPICKELIPVAKSFAKRERLDIVFMGDDPIADQRAMIERMGLGGMAFVNGPTSGRAFNVEKLPHAVLIDDKGTVISKGLVNSREHLESLVTAHELGVVSVQDYLAGLKSPSKVA